MTKKFVRQFIVGLLVSLGYAWFITILTNQYADSHFWDRASHLDGIDTDFCEYTNMAAFIRQPVNTFTNIIYLLVGLYVYGIAIRDYREKKYYNLISANPWYSFTYATIMVFLFFASSYFHSGLTIFGGDLDYSGVFSLSLYPLMYFTHRVILMLRGLPSNIKHPREARILTGIFTLIYLYLTFFSPPLVGRFIVLGMIATMFIFAFFVEMKDPGRTNKLYVWLTIICITIAVVFFGFDNHKILCNPWSFIQPHGIWHLMSGVAAFYFYFYIRSEKNYTTILAAPNWYTEFTRNT
jgi:hypothetical protein